MQVLITLISIELFNIILRWDSFHPTLNSCDKVIELTNEMHLAKRVLKRICDWSMSVVAMTKWWGEKESLKGVMWAHGFPSYALIWGHLVTHLHLIYQRDGLVGSKGRGARWWGWIIINWKSLFELLWSLTLYLNWGVWCLAKGWIRKCISP